MLPLRISLVLAILAGIGVILLSQLVLKPQIEGIIQVRDDNKKGWDKAEGEKRKLTKDLKDTRDDLASTKTELETTKSNYEATKVELTAAQKLLVERAGTIERQKTQIKSLDDELAAWKALGLTVDQVAALRKELDALKLTAAAFTEENKLLLTKVDKLQKIIDNFFGNQDPPVPPTATGKVLVVDPKWDFVVLDIGSKKNLPERGVLLISRNGTLVAKVRVMNVQNDRSIANIMPGWKLKDVMEGDQVFPYAPTNL